MKTNAELQKNVQDAIAWEPLLHAAEIGVTAKDGIVSLTGIVDSYAKKVEAENAAKKVIGVKVLVENIKVKFPNSTSKTDIEVADEIVKAFKSNALIPENMIKVIVEDGQVTLEGEMQWDYQREMTKNAIHYLPGVKAIINNIKIKSEIHDAIKQKDVENAMKMNWVVYDSDIHIKVSGTTVTLTGTVNSWHQKEEACRIAWKTPGIQHVENNLFVDYEYSK
ncbi:BON domain-containing protein [Chryseobacterium limigenitum]|uniref:Osmotically-inducible protein OsmY, contains BON domain n=1 Tax=Chryseobacterium limigenitum TaxID=1612149 RepID=A0A1K2IJB6_9FLAO|nr:BON domain-containing protein [Chryseobacterium limigenitum]SFZ92390.1 Osmotically-inducible protein OsmY, contains BON domain [Chryseobacterium limigenitum]